MHMKLVYTVVGTALLVAAGAATAQTDPKSTPPQEPPAKQEPSVKPAPSSKSDSAMKPETRKITLTDEQAKTWINKPIYSSDGKEIGEVAAFKRGTGNAVIEMHADIGGMLGLGETRVKLTPQQFSLENDRVVLDMTEAQVEKLPKVES